MPMPGAWLRGWRAFPACDPRATSPSLAPKTIRWTRRGSPRTSSCSGSPSIGPPSWPRSRGEAFGSTSTRMARSARRRITGSARPMSIRRATRSKGPSPSSAAALGSPRRPDAVGSAAARRTDARIRRVGDTRSPMTDALDDVALTRPQPSPDAGPIDDRLYDLVEAHFRTLIRQNPLLGTYLGIHTEDHRLGDGSRETVLGDLETERRHLAALEGLDDAGLSEAARFERDLEIHNTRRQIFDTAEIRTWERRSTALDLIGDGIFLIFARDFAPLAERLDAIAGRLEAVPTFLAESRTRAVVPQVRAWQELEIESAANLPGFFAEVTAAASGLPDADRRRLEAAADTARAAIEDYGAWLRSTLERGTDEWALGGERYDELVGLRAFDGLDADAILEIGEDQLEMQKAARIRAAAAVDDRATEATVVDRIKSDHPATFEEALDAYRDVMVR